MSVSLEELQHQTKMREIHWDRMSADMSKTIELLESDPRAMELESVREAIRRLKPVLDAINDESWAATEKLLKLHGDL